MLQIIANIRSRYRWALLAIAILSTAAALLMQYLFAIQKDESLVINIAGKQRMLSQKIAWYSNIINDSHKLQQHPKYKEALENAVTEFQQGH
ncbi:type IV pili methyl-accepting chemotaxis transducer N-terminal domain-containing protein [Pseudoalteromonas neustonica]